MREAEAEAIRLGLRVLTLSLFSSNSRALHVYEKAGYYVSGRIPKTILKSGYVDELVILGFLQYRTIIKNIVRKLLCSTHFT
jgi:ribosomal protein S18 acetylase RimI-like enzyme